MLTFLANAPVKKLPSKAVEFRAILDNRYKPAYRK